MNVSIDAADHFEQVQVIRCDIRSGSVERSTDLAIELDDEGESQHKHFLKSRQLIKLDSLYRFGQY
jgi:hypothetical protein